MLANRDKKAIFERRARMEHIGRHLDPKSIDGLDRLENTGEHVELTRIYKLWLLTLALRLLSTHSKQLDHQKLLRNLHNLMHNDQSAFLLLFWGNREYRCSSIPCGWDNNEVEVTCIHIYTCLQSTCISEIYITQHTIKTLNNITVEASLYNQQGFRGRVLARSSKELFIHNYPRFLSNLSTM